MPKETWVIASILTIVLLLILLGYASWGKKREVERARAELAAALEAADRNSTALSGLKDKLAESQARNEELEREKDSALQTRKSLEEEMRAALESKDVTISQLQGKLTVSIVDRVMFDSGEADLQPAGAAVLRKVAAILTSHPDLKVHVIGHTDNVPIKASARHRFPSNWELSTARATAAVRYLTETAGVDPRRLGAVGYGEFRPVADNGTPEGRARNRRIAITILSEEMAGADTAPALAPKGSVLPDARAMPTNALGDSPAQSLPSEVNVPAAR